MDRRRFVIAAIAAALFTSGVNATTADNTNADRHTSAAKTTHHGYKSAKSSKHVSSYKSKASGKTAHKPKS